SKDFDDLWENRTQMLRVIPFTEAARVIVERSARATADEYELDDLPDGPDDGSARRTSCSALTRMFEQFAAEAPLRDRARAGATAD
ncbi:hypothetical protein ADL27_14210, partial [Streptomyces sp. NRRL F-6602]